MDQIAAVRGAPRTIRVDNGPERVSKRLDQWASAYRVTPDFSRPGKPVDNTLIEAFNGTLRRECLSPRRFHSLDGLQQMLEAWRRGTVSTKPITSRHRTKVH